MYPVQRPEEKKIFDKIGKVPYHNFLERNKLLRKKWITGDEYRKEVKKNAVKPLRSYAVNIDQNGRECTACKAYKLYSEFVAKDRWYESNCKECRNKKALNSRRYKKKCKWRCNGKIIV